MLNCPRSTQKVGEDTEVLPKIYVVCFLVLIFLYGVSKINLLQGEKEEQEGNGAKEALSCVEFV